MEILVLRDKFDEASALYGQVFPTCKRVLGPSHHITLHISRMPQYIQVRREGKALGYC